MYADCQCHSDADDDNGRCQVLPHKLNIEWDEKCANVCRDVEEVERYEEIDDSGQREVQEWVAGYVDEQVPCV